MSNNGVSKRLGDTCFPNERKDQKSSNKFAYQERVAENTLDAAMRSGKAICAIFCGGGKTTVSQWIINKYIQRNGKFSRVLVIAENNNALKQQYFNELNNAHIPINFSFGELTTDQNVQVRIGIAASLHKLPWKEFDLVICDEAHRHFRKRRIQTFLRAVTYKYQILFTGTPAKFIKDNASLKDKTKIVFVNGSELQRKNIFAGVDLDVVRAVNKKNPIQTVRDFIAHSKKVGADLSKALLVCPSIRYAEAVAHQLTAIGKTVFLSTSKNDFDNSILSKSKSWSKSVASESCFIVTVGKCSLGYNDAAVTTLADLRSSLGNLCSNQQVFARILRESPLSQRKFYFRFSSGFDSKSYNEQVLMLVKLKAYMSAEVFTGFDGTNLKLEPDHG